MFGTINVFENGPFVCSSVSVVRTILGAGASVCVATEFLDKRDITYQGSSSYVSLRPSILSIKSVRSIPAR